MSDHRTEIHSGEFRQSRHYPVAVDTDARARVHLQWKTLQHSLFRGYTKMRSGLRSMHTVRRCLSFSRLEASHTTHGCCSTRLLSVDVARMVVTQ